MLGTVMMGMPRRMQWWGPKILNAIQSEIMWNKCHSNIDLRHERREIVLTGRNVRKLLDIVFVPGESPLVSGLFIECGQLALHLLVIISILETNTYLN